MIETRRLKILPFNELFITETYIGWLNDKELLKYSEQRHFKHDYQSCLSYLKSFENSENIFAAIIEKESGRHIGNINSYLDQFNRTADMGLLVGDASAQGKGYGLEAWLALMAFIFNNKKIRKITAGTMALNLAMLKVMDSSQMQRETNKRRQFLYNGTEVDLITSAIFKEDFEALVVAQKLKF